MTARRTPAPPRPREPWPTGTLPDAGPLTAEALAGQWSAWADGAAALGEDAAAGRLREAAGDNPIALAYSRLLAGDLTGAGRALADHPESLDLPAGRLVNAALSAARGSGGAYEEVRAAAEDPTFRASETLRLLAVVADTRGDRAIADAAWWRLVHDAGADDLPAATRFAIASVAMRYPGSAADAVQAVVVDAVAAIARTGRSAQAARSAVRQVVRELRGRGDPQGAHLVLAAHLAVAEPDAELRADLKALEKNGAWRVAGFVALTLVCVVASAGMPIALLVPAIVAQNSTYPGLDKTASAVRRSLRPRRAPRGPAAHGDDDGGRCRCWYTATLADQEASRYLADHLLPSATSACAVAVATQLGPGTTVARCPDTSARWLVGPLGAGNAPLALRGLLVRPSVPDDDDLRTGFYL